MTDQDDGGLTSGKSFQLFENPQGSLLKKFSCHAVVRGLDYHLTVSVRKLLEPCHAGLPDVLLSRASKQRQLGNADQIVGDEVDQEVAGNTAKTSMLGLAHGAVLLAPAEDALDHRAT